MNILRLKRKPVGLKEEVQSWEAEKGGDSAPGELPPKQGGLCPLHQAVPLGPDDPSGSQTQLGCGGSPSEGWDEAPGHCRHSEVLWHR